MSAYHNADIPEYWLIDARDDGDLRFTIYKRGPKGYVAGRAAAGWVRSPVLGKQFRLTEETGGNGHPRFRLEAR